MSVLVIATFKGDSHAFRASLHQRASEYEAWMAKSTAAGAIHHQFGITADSVMVVDEWASEDDFSRFFADPALQQFISEVGSDGTPPQVLVYEAIDSPDRF